MNLLLPYYLLLVAGAVLLAALHNSTLVSQRRNLHLSHLLIPPLVLVLMVLNLPFPLGLVLTLALLLAINRLLRRSGEQTITRATFRLWLVLWLIEAVLPLSLHLALRSHPESERISLLVGGLVLLGGPLLLFLVFAPDLRKQI